MREPDRAPDLRVILDALNAGWRRHAACRGEERLFLPDRALDRAKNLGSPSVVLALFICSGCPVRSECLTESLRDVRVDLDPLSDAKSRPSATVPGDGIWGGTTTADRAKVRHLPRDEAAAQLERSFPARLARHIAAFRRKVQAKPPSRWTRRERRLLAMLEEQQVAGVAAHTRRRCVRCDAALPVLSRSDRRYCSGRCQVASYRARAA